MLGALLFLPSFWFMPHVVYLLPLVYLAATGRLRLGFDDRNFNLLMIWVGFGLLFALIGLFDRTSEIDSAQYIPWFPLVLITYLYAKALTRSDLNIYLSLVLIEVLVICLESSSQVPTFFFDWSVSRTFHGLEEEGLLYFSRPYGFDENSSGPSYRLLIAACILSISKLPSKLSVLYGIIIAIGLTLTFNRTTLISAALLMVVSVVPGVVASKKRVIILVVLVLASSLSVYLYGELLAGQFSRNQEEVGLSGRDVVWGYYWNQIYQNPILGNFMDKVYFLWNGRDYHAHNSYLQLFATAGVPMGLLYLYIVFRNLNRNNFAILAAFAVHGMAQYSFGWGVSFVDIFLFFFAFFSQRFGSVRSSHGEQRPS